jgi:hypothetical protein
MLFDKFSGLSIWHLVAGTTRAKDPMSLVASEIAGQGSDLVNKLGGETLLMLKTMTYGSGV